MKKGHATAVRDLRARAMRGVLYEGDLEKLAQKVLPGWQTFQVDWWLYEFQTPTDQAGPLQKLEAEMFPKQRESGYGLMHFGIGGYGDGALMLLIKREEYEAKKGIFTHAIFRFELDLVLSGPDGSMAFINCETGAVRYGTGFPQAKAPEQDLSCKAAEAESVAVIAPDQPKTLCPEEGSILSAGVAVNPGRALEFAGQEVAA